MMEDFDARRAALELVTAFVNNNRLTAKELPVLIGNVFDAVSAFGQDAPGDGKAPVTARVSGEGKATAKRQKTPVEAAAVEAAPTDTVGKGATPAPAVSIEESISNPGFIISLITGEKLKTLKRHLRFHGLTPSQYRERYGLAADYPLVAPAYSQVRRAVAQKMGLGRKSGSPAAAEVKEPKKSPSTRRKAAPANAEAKGAAKTTPQRKAGTKRAKIAPLAVEGASGAEIGKTRAGGADGKSRRTEGSSSSRSAPSAAKPAKAVRPKPTSAGKGRAAAGKAKAPAKDAAPSRASDAPGTAAVAGKGNGTDTPADTKSEDKTSKRTTLSPVFGE